MGKNLERELYAEKETSNGSGFLRNFSNLAKNKLVQLSLAGLMGFTGLAGCAPSKGDGGGNKNHAPQITTASIPSGTENQSYSAQISYTDSDGDLGDCLLTSKPSFLNVRNLESVKKCEVYGDLPEVSSDTNYPLTLKVTDPSGDSDTRNYNLLIKDNSVPNNPPVITSSPVTTVNENSPYSYQVLRNDPDGDSTTCSLTEAPIFLTINSTSCLVSGNSFEVNSDETHPVTVKVEDTFGAPTNQNYNLTIKNVEQNLPPEINTSTLGMPIENQPGARSIRIPPVFCAARRTDDPP